MNMQQPYPSGPPFGQPGMPAGGPGGFPLGRPEAAETAKGKKKDKKGAGGKKKAPGSARQQARRTGLIATLLALLAVLGGIAVLRKPEPVQTWVAVVRAGKVLSAGKALPGDRAALEALIEVKNIPEMYVETGALQAGTKERVWELLTGADLTSFGKDWTIAGRRPKYPILEGQQIHPDPVFSDTIELARPLAVDERLVTITIDVSRALLGALRAGDKIDVFTYVNDTTNDIGSTDIYSDQTTTTDELSVSPDGVEGAATAGPRLLVRQAEIVVARNSGAIGDPTQTDAVPNVYIVRVKVQDAVTLISADGSGRTLYVLYRGEPEKPTGGTPETTGGAPETTAATQEG